MTNTDYAAALLYTAERLATTELAVGSAGGIDTETREIARTLLRSELNKGIAIGKAPNQA